MSHGKKKYSSFREASKTSKTSKKGPPLGLAIALAAAGGVVIGSTGTYFYLKPLVAQKLSASPATGGTLQSIATPPQQQFIPAPQPPGEVPPGKVWSVEHGHWHDVPVALTIPAPAPAPPETTPASAPPTVTPAATTTPAPAAAPTEKKE